MTYGTGMGVQLYAWDTVTVAWVKLLCNAAGKLIIDPSEILEDTPTDGEVGKAPTSNWAHDHADLPNVHHARQHALNAGADHTGRAALSQMPDGTATFVLTAQGAGSDPAYAAAGGIPSGVICMWHGTIANIPTGWVICNGSNGTPNLLARFVEGVATAATNPGTTGGKSTIFTTTLAAYRNSYSAAVGELAGINLGTNENRPPFYDVAFIMKT